LWALDAAWSFRKIVFLLNIGIIFPILATVERKNLVRILEGLVIGAVALSISVLLEALLQFVIPLEQVIHLWTNSVLPFFLGQNFSLAVRDYPSLLVNILGTTYLRATGTFPDPHTLSLYLGISLPLALAWYSQKKKLFHATAFVLISVAFLLTFSRGAYIALFLSGSISFGILFFSNYKKHGVRLLVIAFLMMGVILVTPVGPRILSSFSMEDGSRVERLRLLEEATRASFERPFLGVGIGNYPLFVKPEAASREPIYVHNLYLDIVVEQGFVGLIFFLSFIGYALWRGFFEWQKTKDMYALACFSGALYFLLHGIFEAPLFSFHVMFGLLILVTYQVLSKKETL
jgi:O-antigen ligase